MFNLKNLFLLFITVICNSLLGTANPETIIIKPLSYENLASLIDMDRRITDEHFKPIFSKYYAHLPIGQDPDSFLESDLKNDIEIFRKYIKNPASTQQVLIAYDICSNKCAGVIIFHQKDLRLTIDLLMLDKEYRRLGIGKKLIQQAMSFFTNITLCTVSALKFGNDEARSFYESLGFVNGGEPEDDEPHSKDLHLHYQLDIRK